MKSNIIIAGVPRAGKSTLSRRIANKYGYQHVSMDSIIAGFERNFPELNINTYADMPSFDILVNISGKIAPFINTMMESGEYDEFDRGMVLDVYQLLPEDFEKFVNKEFCKIYYLLTADVTPEERFLIQKKYDTRRDYSFYLSDEELREGCTYIVEQSRIIKEQCRRYGLAYYETSRDREAVFERLLEQLGAR